MLGQDCQRSQPQPPTPPQPRSREGSMNAAGPGPDSSQQETAAFGFRQVAAETRQGLVNEVFATVARRYDLMNDLMSGGLHRLWKDDLITWLNPPRSGRAFSLVDVAAGTGDISLKALSDGGPG